MKYYVIINGNSSLNIQGLAIESLPNISKPLIRTTREEIDGRDGDIITKLGYSAYDKTLNIGLWGNYDINEVIAFFNQEGVITFSNEPDKYYKFTIVNRIDFVNELEKFKKASITIHCQPFKYQEQPEIVAEEEAVELTGTSFTISDSLEAPLLMDLKGNTSQTGTPTPSSPIPVNVVNGDNQVIVCGKNLFDKNSTTDSLFYNVSTGEVRTDVSTWSQSSFIGVSNNNYTLYTTYTANTNSIEINEFDKDKQWIKGVQISLPNNTYTFTPSSDTKYIRVGYRNDRIDLDTLQLEKGSTATTYTPYTGTTYNIDLPVENLMENILTNQEINGLTFVVNSDKSILVNGTASATTTLTLSNGISNLQVGKTYYLSGCPKGGSGSTYRLFIRGTGNEDIGNGLEFEMTQALSSSQGIGIQIGNGTTINNLVFKPMITKIKAGYEAYTPYGTTPIELCKIGTYQDYIYKDNDKWYLHKEIEKLTFNGSEAWSLFFNTNGIFVYNPSSQSLLTDDTINGLSNYYTCTTRKYIINNLSDANNVFSIYAQELVIANKSISSVADFKTWLSTHRLNVYYILKTPTNTEITYQPLINQLNALEDAESYEGTTNINQVNNDLPFILGLTYFTGDNTITITNDGNIYSKPLLRIKGTSDISISLNGIQIFQITLQNNEIIIIDTEKMEAYYDGMLKNRQVIGDYNNFKLNPGENTIEFNGAFDYVRISRYSRWV